MSTNGDGQDTITITFIANHAPLLPDDTYTLEIKQTLTGDTEDHTFSKTYTFEVCGGPRFALSPDQIYKVFPPPDTLGDYDTLLPHIVFTLRRLPWQRTPKNDPATTRSWLALLVFAQSEAPKPNAGTIDSLSSPPQGTYSYASETGKLTLEPGEKSTDALVYLDIPTDVFAKVAPSLNDLAWNAHARLRTDTPKYGLPSSTDYAVVVANRVPPAGQTAVVHLVSLEGLGDALPGDDGTPSATLSSYQYVRLASLKSWSFQVGPLQASFKDLLKGLNTKNDPVNTGGTWDTQTWQPQARDSQLRLPWHYQPAAAPAGAPAKPFDSGYTVLAGPGSSCTWYRGPFVPSMVTPPAADDSWASKTLPADDTAELNITVSTKPANDCTYAAAWQLGRLLALADKGFATAQVAWKRDCRMQLNQLICKAATGGASRVKDSNNMRDILKSASLIQKYLGNQLTTTAGTSGSLFIPLSLVDWLGKLALLKSVPFNYLVPDASMLPTESLRFFQVDPRWLACLLDGAWSLEREPARGKDVAWAFDAAYQPWSQLQAGTLTPSFVTGTCWPKGGILLTSRLVSGYWPNICFDTDTSAKLLREDRLSPSMLLALYDNTYKTFTIQEPPEGIHFGFDMDNPPVLTKDSLRDANGDPKGSLGSIPQRGAGVIQFQPLSTSLNNALEGQFENFTTAEFALELVEDIPGATFTLPT